MRVLICGGGVIGASIAYFLSCRGVQAIVIERTASGLRGIQQGRRLFGPGLVRRNSAGSACKTKLCTARRTHGTDRG